MEGHQDGWGLEHVPCEKRLRILGFSLENRRIWGVLIPIFQNLWRGYQEDKARLIPDMYSGRMIDSHPKLKQERFWVALRKNFYYEDNYLQEYVARIISGSGGVQNPLEDCTQWLPNTPSHLSDSGILVEMQVGWTEVLEPLYKYWLRRIWNLLIQKTVWPYSVIAVLSTQISAPVSLALQGKICFSLFCNFSERRNYDCLCSSPCHGVCFTIVVPFCFLFTISWNLGISFVYAIRSHRYLKVVWQSGKL